MPRGPSAATTKVRLHGPGSCTAGLSCPLLASPRVWTWKAIFVTAPAAEKWALPIPALGGLRTLDVARNDRD